MAFAGKGVTCRDVITSETEAYMGHLTMIGSIEGSDVSVKQQIYFVTRPTDKTFIQTDKYLYRPGHEVQFRILSLEGPLLQISTREVRRRETYFSGVATLVRSGGCELERNF